MVHGAQESSEPRSVKVTRVIDQPLTSVWDALMRPGGTEALLGAGGSLGNKGEDWRATDGTYGSTRSFHPQEQIRFSWHASEGAPRTMVDLQIKPANHGTELALVHDQLPDDADHDALAQHWERALDRIAAAPADAG